jgi:predicted NodU family carbamoyl transferase
MLSCSAILGIHASRADSAACLVIDGVGGFATAEERLGRQETHSPRFPVQDIYHVPIEWGARRQSGSS